MFRDYYIVFRRRRRRPWSSWRGELPMACRDGSLRASCSAGCPPHGGAEPTPYQVDGLVRRSAS